MRREKGTEDKKQKIRRDGRLSHPSKQAPLGPLYVEMGKERGITGLTQRNSTTTSIR